jgi:hypothetical protein
MLMGGLRVLFGMLTMLLSRHSMCFRFVVLAHVVMMCRLKVVMGRCVMMSGSSVMVLAGSVLLFFRHLNRHVNVLLNKSVSALSNVPVVNPLRPRWCANSQSGLPPEEIRGFAPHSSRTAKDMPSDSHLISASVNSF